jgi:hypothetical protein
MCLSALLFVVFAAGCEGNANQAAPDTTRPTVAFVNPANLATNVPVNRKITANFSEAMAPLTITASTFTVRQGTTPVSGTVAYAGTTATFTPASNLAASAVYTATITTGVKDLAGNALASTCVWSFISGTISDATPPTVTLVNPANLATDVPVNRVIAATFSEAMDPLTITAATFIIERAAAPVTGTVARAGTGATFTPASKLAASTVYTATITTGVKDLAGNALAADYVWSFTTGVETVALNPVVLGETSHFAVLAGAAVTDVPASIITGDVGVSPAAESFITGFSETLAGDHATSPQVIGGGFIYAADMVSPTPDMLTQAKGDLTIAYNDAAGRTPVPTGAFLNPGVGNLSGLNLVPGLYKFTGQAIATTGFSLTGGANDVWIFQVASDLNISNDVHVTLAGSAQAKNIFWQVGTQATLGTGVIFHGTIMADASVTMDTGATLNGRALAFTGTIALDQNTITVPAP